MSPNRSLLLALAFFAVAGCGGPVELEDVAVSREAASPDPEPQDVCSFDSDCSLGSVCRKLIGISSGTCVPGCRSEFDCFCGSQCQVPLICVGYQEPCIGQCFP